MSIIAHWQQKSVQLREEVPVDLPNGATVKLRRADFELPNGKKVPQRKAGLVQLSANYECKVYDSDGNLSVESMWVNEFVLHSGHLEFDLLEETVTFTTS